jgi:hypothetical protein
MSRVAVPILALVLGALLTSPARADDPPDAAAHKAKVEAARRKLVADRADFEKRVNEAIERGAAWLRTQQRKDGSFPGFSDDLKPHSYNIMEIGVDALVVLTLAHCGANAKDDGIRKCLDFCRFHYSGGKGSMNLVGNDQLTVYVAATLILALDALYHPERAHRRKPRRDRYGNVRPPKPERCRYPASVRKWIQDMVAFLVAKQVRPAGGWRYPGNPLGSPAGDTDLSNTQYALLALDAAARCGIDAPPETWQAAARYALETQDKDGLDAPIWVENEAWEPGFDKPSRFVKAGTTLARGWTYLPGDTELPTGSMGAAGVTCLGLCKERLWILGKLTPEVRGRIDRGILSGLAWLAQNFSVTENPTPGGASAWHYYYLYGLERAGVKLGTRWIGTHDWYREGAEHLLAAQETRGGWKEADGTVRPADATESAITQTCFALLFLKRSTRKPFVPMMPPITGGGAAPSDGR